jgi:peptide-methionine (R)-S-oxide reductase
VLRKKGTERPGTGQYVDHTEEGTYTCAGCGNALFTSKNKFDSGCGWPSFDDVLSGEGVTEHEDITLGMRRVEVTCSQCGGHLGHVFPDGPKETTGLRYCINSVALNFKPRE